MSWIRSFHTGMMIAASSASSCWKRSGAVSSAKIMVGAIGPGDQSPREPRSRTVKVNIIAAPRMTSKVTPARSIVAPLPWTYQ